MTGPDDGLVRVATAEYVGELEALAGRIGAASLYARARLRTLCETAEEVTDYFAFAAKSGPPDADDYHETARGLQALLDEVRRSESDVVTLGQGVAVLADALGRLQSACRKAAS